MTMRAYVALLLLALCVPVLGQSVPNVINYQGRLVDGTALVNGNVVLTLRLYTNAVAEIDEELLYEDSDTVTVVDGLYAVALGAHPVDGDLRDALLHSPVYVEAEVDGTILLPRHELTSVGYAIIPGVRGNGNTEAGKWSNIDGGLWNSIYADNATIGGGSHNDVAYNSSAAAIGGGELNKIDENCPFGTVAGGYDNILQYADHASIGGGRHNYARGTSATIAGGEWNRIYADNATISGGGTNTIMSNASGSAIGGGVRNSIGASSRRSVIGGGFRNGIGPYAYASVVAGGDGNEVQDSAYGSAVGGGEYNVIETNAPHSVIAGGHSNRVQGSAEASTIGGGAGNCIGLGVAFAMIPGGALNYASGDASFAAGLFASATNDGAFVWADNNLYAFASQTSNQFSARCVGGARFVSAIDGAGNPTAGVQLFAGGNSWSGISDRNAKENFESVDPSEILEALDAIPVTRWNMRSQDPAIRHMGPMAQDFHDAFGLGESDHFISSSDADGVALAAIQGLYRITRERDREIEQLREENTELRERLGVLEQRLEQY